MEPSVMSIGSSDSETESRLISLPNFNIGLPSDFSELNLPTNRDVLKYYLFLSDLEKEKNKKQHSYSIFTSQVAKKLIEIWSKLHVMLIHAKSVAKKLKTLLSKYQNELRFKYKRNKSSDFWNTINDVFYIGKCQCEKTMLCHCGLIPAELQEFMIDQHSTRKHTFPECILSTVEQESSFMPASCDPTYEPASSNMDVEFEIDNTVLNTSQPIVMQKALYTKRYDALNFAMMCDRFGISDRVASCLATALFKDIGFKDENGEPIIMDKSKVAREKAKCRDSMRKKRCHDSNLIAFSFDGRKNTSLAREEVNGTYHSRMVKESHLVVIKEPESKLLGHLKVDAEDANTKQKQLNNFFLEKNISLANLIGICCDGEVTNTGTENGILRRFEIMFDRPLHWFVCLLHFNELPLRHLFCALEKCTTSGPRTANGTLSKLIETCEQLPVSRRLFW